MLQYAIQSAFNHSATTSSPTGLVKGISESISALFKPVNQGKKRLRDKLSTSIDLIEESPKRQKIVEFNDRFCKFRAPVSKGLAQIPASAISLMDFPDETILLILRDLPPQAALALLQCNRRLRSVVAESHLKRHGFVVRYNDVDDIVLQGEVPSSALCMLSSYPFVDRVTLCCDLYYMVEYENLFLQLLRRLKVVVLFYVYFDPRDLVLLHDPRTPSVILSAIAAVPGGIFSFRIEKSFDPPPARVLSQLPHPPRRFNYRGLSHSISQINYIGLSMEFPVSKPLFEIYERLLRGKAVTSLVLSDHSTCSTFNDLIRTLKLPALTHLQLLITSQCGIRLHRQLFSRHPLLQSMSLYTYGINSQMPDPPTKKLFLPSLERISLTSNHNSWLHRDPPVLKHLQIQLPLSLCNPRSRTFCSTMRTLADPLESMSAQPFAGLTIELNFPNSLGDHILHCYETGKICDCAPPQLSVTQATSLVIGLRAFHPLTLCFLSAWIKLFPSLEDVTIKAADSQPNPSWAPIIREYLMDCSATLKGLRTFKFSIGKGRYSVWIPYKGLTSEGNPWIET